MTKCHRCWAELSWAELSWAALRGSIFLFITERQEKSPRTQRNKSRKRWCCEQKLCWKDECRFDLFHLFFAEHTGNLYQLSLLQLSHSFPLFTAGQNWINSLFPLSSAQSSLVCVHVADWPGCKAYTCVVLSYTAFRMLRSELCVHSSSSAQSSLPYSCCGGGVNQSFTLFVVISDCLYFVSFPHAWRVRLNDHP